MSSSEKVAVMLQARLNSSRLPQKILMPLGGKRLIEQAMESLKGIHADYYILLTDHDSYSILESSAKRCGFFLFEGSASNVLNRYVSAIEAYPVDIVIRATGDNPLVSSEAGNYALELFKKKDVDYLALDDLPLGTGVEVARASALKKAESEAVDPYDLEHVCPYLYQNPQLFKCLRLKVPPKWRKKELSVTVDKMADYLNVKKIYDALYREKAITLNQLIAFLPPAPKQIFYPSIEEGNGMGHLIRMLRIASHFDSVAFFSQEPQRLCDLAMKAGFGQPWFLHSGGAASVKMILTDCRTMKELPPELKALAVSVLSLDEGGSFREESDYLIDSLPSLSKSGPNCRISPLFTVSTSKQDDNGLKKRSKKTSMEKKSENPSSLLKNQKKIPEYDLLVSFGGEDPKDLIDLFLQKWFEKQSYSYKIAVVLGPSYKGALTYQRERYAKLSVDFIFSPYSLEPYLESSKIILTSFGLTAYEALQKGKKVYLLQPSSYHHQLALLDGFLSWNKNEVTQLVLALGKEVKKLHRKEQEAIFIPTETNKNSFFENRKKIEDFLTEFHPSPVLSCPLCQSKKRKALYRSEYRTFFRCHECKNVYQQLYRKQEERYSENYFFEEYQAQYGKSYLEDFQPIYQSGLRRCKEIQKLFPRSRRFQPHRILDVGSAYGHFLVAAKLYGWQPFGIDVSLSAVNYMQKKGFCAFCSDFQEGRHSDEAVYQNSYDVVTFWYVLEHFHRLDSVLDTVCKILKKGGIFAIAVPNLSGISAKKDFLKFLQNSPEDHFSLFSPKALKAFLKKKGFSKIKIVVTGHHPERFFPKVKIKKGSLLYRILFGISKIGKLGDTFELYAQWRELS